MYSLVSENSGGIKIWWESNGGLVRIHCAMLFCYPTAPPKPTGFKVTQTTNTSIFLSWDIPDHSNGIFMGFKLNWWSTYPDGINMVGNSTLSTADGMAEIGELYPGVEFQFMLVMYNDVGDSMEAAYIQSKTMPDCEWGVYTVEGTWG